MTQFKIVVEKHPDTYVACPLGLKRVVLGQGDSYESALEEVKAAISFIKPYNGVRNIYVKGIEEPFDAARPVTADSRPVPEYFWSQDSRYVLYVQNKDGDENFHIYWGASERFDLSRAAFSLLI